MPGFRHWKWHLDEMYVRANDAMVYLWRAVDHEGEVLESCVTKSRDKAAAPRFMKKALKRHGSPAYRQASIAWVRQRAWSGPRLEPAV